MSILPRGRKAPGVFPQLPHTGTWDEKVSLPPIPTISGGTVQVPPPPSYSGPWYKNPSIPGVLMSIGAALSQPPQLGQNTWGRIGEALGQGYNYLAQQAAMRQAQWEEAWKRAMELEKLRAEQEKQRKEAEISGREATVKERQATVAERKATVDEQLAKLEAEKHKSEETYKEKLLKLKGDELNQEWNKHQDQLKLEREKLDMLKAQKADEMTIRRQELKVKDLQSRAAWVRAVAALKDKEGKERSPDDIYKDPKLFSDIFAERYKARLSDPYAMSGPDYAEKAKAQALQDVEDLYKRLKAGPPGSTQQAPLAKVTAKGVELPAGIKEGDVVQLDVPEQLRKGDLSKYHGKRMVYKGGRLLPE